MFMAALPAHRDEERPFAMLSSTTTGALPRAPASSLDGREEPRRHDRLLDELADAELPRTSFLREVPETMMTHSHRR